MATKLTASTSVSNFLASQTTDSAREAIGLHDTLSLANATTRKTLSSYDGVGGPQPGATRVIQSDLPGVLWTLIAADVTSDASWIGAPYTSEPNGDIVVKLKLADFSGTVPDENVLGQVGGVPTIGDGVTTGGKKITSFASLSNNKPEGYLLFTSIKSTSDITGIIHQAGATGICYSINGDTPVFVSGTNISFNFGRANGSLREIAVWPATSATSGRVGDITYFSCGNSNVTSIDVTGLSAMESLYVTYNNLTSIDLTGCNALKYLYVDFNNLTSIDLTELSALQFVGVSYNPITSLDISNNSDLRSISIASTNIASIDLSQCPNLYDFISSGNTDIGLLDFSLNPNMTYIYSIGCSSLTTLNISNVNPPSSGTYDFTSCTNLTNIIGNNFIGVNSNYGSYYAFKLSNCGLTTDAVWSMLNQFANASATSFIVLLSNPCDKNDGATTPEALVDGENYVESDIQSLLTQKGYTLVLSDATLVP